MPKTLYRRENKALLKLLKDCRAHAKLTQTQCSDALGRPQSFMSDVECGVRRLDIIQLRDLCMVFGISLEAFVVKLEQEIQRTDSSNHTLP
ncbi:XRE family transcriptional regulator [Alteromonadaceae bacterium M269]|nr:XRE family transcriptional regulator [Alteromonadaceae bacterium M269]